MAKTYLFNPGPVMVKDSVRQALLHYDICHRSAEFEDLFCSLKLGISRLFEADDSYDSVMVSGSGTSANEAVLSSIFAEGEAVMLIRNGEFGERLLGTIIKYGVPLVDVPFEWGEYPDVDRIEAAMKDASDVKAVAMVFHETSTGMINPVKEVGELCRKYGKAFFVDAISAAGGEYVNVLDNNIDIVTSVGGKCVGAFPGSAYVCGKKSLLGSLTFEQGKNVYLNLATLYGVSRDRNQTPNTPNVNIYWALDAALSDIHAEGLSARIKRYRDCASIIRKGVRELGLSLLIPEELMSNTVTSAMLPEGIPLKKFIAEMEKRGFTLYEGKGPLIEKRVFQIANMGEIYEEECGLFLKALKGLLDEWEEGTLMF